MAPLSAHRVLLYVAGAAVVLIVGAWSVFGNGAPDGEAVDVSVPAAGGAFGEPATDSLGLAAADDLEPSAVTTTTLAPIFVQVAGAVRRPGVYEVPAGSRVFEVLARAGGVTAEGDEEALPLAASLVDGARIVVPGESDDYGAGSAGGAEPSGGVFQSPSPTGGGGEAAIPGTVGSTPVSLATATVEQLDSLPGIGPSLARQIVTYRETHGPFAAVEALDDVPGIGPATVAKLEGLVVP